MRSRRLNRSPMLWKTTKKMGTKKTARMVEAIMPPNTAVPSALAGGSRSFGDGQRHDAQDEGERRHDDRSEAKARRPHGCFLDTFTPITYVAGEFDDQDRVFAGQRNDQHDADLRVDVVVHATNGDRGDRSQQTERHDQNHRCRREPAFILSGQDEVDQQHGHHEDQNRLSADFLLLVRHAGPVVSHGAAGVSPGQWSP